MKTIDRIFQYLEIHNIKPSKAERDLGVGNGTLAKARDRSGGITSDILEKFISFYSDVSLKWLLTGMEPMIISQNTKNSQTELPPGPCQQCELRERLLHVQEDRISELQSRLSELTACQDSKSKAHCA
jgi:hypothetical protein